MMNLNTNMLGANQATWAPEMQNLKFLDFSGIHLQNLNSLSQLQNLRDSQGDNDDQLMNLYTTYRPDQAAYGMETEAWAQDELMNLKFGRRLKKAAAKVGTFALKNGPQLVEIYKATQAI